MSLPAGASTVVDGRQAVVVLEADPLRARALADLATRGLLSASVFLAGNYEYAVDLFHSPAGPATIILIGLSVAGRDWWRHIGDFVHDFPRQSILLAAEAGTGRVLRALRTLEAGGLCSQIHDTDETIIRAVRAVAMRRRFVSPAVEWSMQDRTELRPETILTPLEETVLSFTGVMRDKELAVVLDLTREALRRHRSNIAQRLGLAGIGQLVAYALKHGYVCALPRGGLVPGLVHAINVARASAAQALGRRKVKRAELTIVRSSYW